MADPNPIVRLKALDSFRNKTALMKRRPVRDKFRNKFQTLTQSNHEDISIAPEVRMSSTCRLLPIVGCLLVALCAVSWTPVAEASSFVNVTVGGSSATCNNSTAEGVTACATAGFITSLGSDSIQFAGTVGGYFFGAVGDVGLLLSVSEPPPYGGFAFLRTNIQHVSGSAAAVIDFGANDFMVPHRFGPYGPQLDASRGLNWSLSTAGDSMAFTAWGRNDNMLTAGPAGATVSALLPECVSPGGASICFSVTEAEFFDFSAPFALTGRHVFHSAVGTVARYSGSVHAGEPVPEPSSLVLLGMGVALLLSRRMRRK